MQRSLLAVLALASFAGAVHAETLIGLRESDFHLISFDSATPGTITGELTLSGLPAGEQVIALDFRPSSGQLILVGSAPSNMCQLYTVNTTTGALTAAGALFSCVGSISEVDINPVPDRLRVFSDANSYRVNPADGVKTQDTPVAYAAGDAGASTTSPEIAGAAYDRNLSGATLTTLFALEAERDVLVRVGSVDGTPNSPNGGQLSSIGALGVDVSSFPPGGAPFDISGATGVAYLFTFDPPFGTSNGSLRTVNLTTGAASAATKIGAANTSFNLLGMTVAPGISLPAASGGGGSGGGSSSARDGGAFGWLSLLALLPATLRRRRRA